MDKITEEVLMSLIKRVEALEEKVTTSHYKSPISNQSRDPGLASKAQMDLIVSLGGVTWEDMTKKSAGRIIDELKVKKQMNYHPKAVLPTQVEDRLAERNTSKPLTKKELEELERVGGLL